MSKDSLPKAFLLEDDQTTREALTTWMETEGFVVQAAKNLAEARKAFEGEPVSVAVLDREVPDGDGLDLLREGRTGDADVVLVTGHSETEVIVEAMQIGALDYLEKPVDLERLGKLLGRSKSRWKRNREVQSALDQADASGGFGYLVGKSASMMKVYGQVARVAPTDATVFVVGETGTGKDVLARTIGHFSRRAKEPFVAINCGAIPSNLVESELFGHVKGAFTGAVRDRAGVFERADGGTLFLDELTEMSNDLQTRLLRVLENRKVTRVGDSEPRSVNVRVIAATNRDPRRAVADGELREDLLYRLLVFPIELPPLRSRKEDIDLLVDHFLARASEEYDFQHTLDESVRNDLRRHHWPGNVRELRNAIDRLVILRADTFDPNDLLPAIPKDGPPADGTLGIKPGMSIADAERRLIEATLDFTDNDKNEAAQMLGISLKTLYNRLNKYEEDDGASEDA